MYKNCTKILANDQDLDNFRGGTDKGGGTGQGVLRYHSLRKQNILIFWFNMLMLMLKYKFEVAFFKPNGFVDNL